MPGTADDVVVVHFGYGRTRGRPGRHAASASTCSRLRTSQAPWFDGGAQIATTGETYVLASTQNHFAMEGRQPGPRRDAEEYRHEPEASVAELGPRAAAARR